MEPKKIVILIAHEGYQPIEYGVTKEVLAQNPAIAVLTASNKPGEATATDGSKTVVDLTVDKIDPKTIDGLFLVGGSGALEALDNPQVYALLQEMKTLKKPFGSICISSRILAKAGVLGGKKATGWDGDDKLNGIFNEHAVTYTRKPVTTNGLIVTATDPRAAEKFGQSIIHVLKST